MPPTLTACEKCRLETRIGAPPGHPCTVVEYEREGTTSVVPQTLQKRAAF
jgi:hypothetical protein